MSSAGVPGGTAQQLVGSAAEMAARLGVEGAPPEAIASFVEQYYRFVAPADLLDRDRRAALPRRPPSHLELALTTDPRHALVGSRADGEKDGGPDASSRSSPTTCRSWSTRSSAELTRHDLGDPPRRAPRLRVRRDAVGQLLDVLAADAGQLDDPGTSESFIHVEIDPLADPDHARCPAQRRAPGARGRPGGRGGLGPDGLAPRGGRRARRRTAPRAAGLRSALDARRRLHVPRLPRVRPRGRRGRPRHSRRSRGRASGSCATPA